MLSKSSNGTWNRSIPSLFRTAIDYILIPNDKYIVKNIGIKEYDNSDHLCIFTERMLKLRLKLYYCDSN